MTAANLLTLTADIVTAHVSSHAVAAEELPVLVEKVHEALASLGQPADDGRGAKVPMVSAGASVKPGYLVCMECGKKQKLLKRHLKVAHGLTPEQYRAEFGLPGSYPMTAPEYSTRRGNIAREFGLGGRAGRKPDAGAGPAPQADPSP